MDPKSSVAFVHQPNPECVYKKPKCEMMISWTNFLDYYVMRSECTICGCSSSIQFLKENNTTLD